ncbi:MAG TPA: hypothetical protein DCP69_12975 [Candidatus Omnitrophica bacterium]|nr:hypothetical protein [Candidatus Omnitrophota bacterium]
MTAQGRPGVLRTGGGGRPVLKPGSLQWAAGYEQGSQYGQNHPNNQDWLDGWTAGYYAAMDERFPGWRTPR